ncbi:hypothetical protein DFH06DRAFT_1421362 [Mycena polygramma]|nr:hypothetical protein DFH06DRAFT_1421362 [Mycena polygramma]
MPSQPTYRTPQRINPYARTKPLLLLAPGASDPPMVSAHQRLYGHNIVNKKLVTWGHGLSNDWDEVPRPQRVTSRGPVDIAATGFDKVWGRTTSPFYCPHETYNGHPFNPLVLRLGGTFEGGIADYYHAIDHPCAFKIVVPPLKERRLLVSWEDRLEYHGEHQEEPIDNFDSTPPSSQGSSSSSTSVGSTLSSSSSSVISRLAVQAMLDPSPRYSCGGPVALFSPTPAGKGTPLANVPGPLSFYRRSVAEARKLADISMMEYLHQIDKSGVLEDDPSSHPAWDAGNPHTVLHIYDQRLYPRCLERTYNHLQFVYKPLGQAVRQLNCALGLPYGDYATLVRSTRSCHCCKSHFSLYGYNDHRKEGRCSNHPDLEEVEECDMPEPVFRFRSLRNNQLPRKIGETLDTSIGSALLEWNSRLGVPADVWMAVSTAIFHCKDCDLVRSFPAHLLHLDDDGACADPGQEPIIRGRGVQGGQGGSASGSGSSSSSSTSTGSGSSSSG